MKNEWVEEWTKEAVLTYEKVLENLVNKKSNKTVLKFLNRIDEVIVKLRQNPYLFQESLEYSPIRRVVVTPEVTLFFRIEEKTVQLISFWEYWWNPKDLYFR